MSNSGSQFLFSLNLGNLQPWEMDTCVTFALIPTVSCVETIRSMGEALRTWQTKNGESTHAQTNGSVSNGDMDSVARKRFGNVGCLNSNFLTWSLWFNISVHNNSMRCIITDLSLQALTSTGYIAYCTLQQHRVLRSAKSI